MPKSAAIPINSITEDNLKEITEKKPKTDKKYLNQAAKLVRRLDNVLTGLNKVAHDSRELEADMEDIPNTEINEKDFARVTELTDTIEAVAEIIYYVTARMSRKYVGKEIASLENKKRESLKIK